MDFSKDALTLHNFIRGNDKIPGAWAEVEGQKINLYGSKFVDCYKPVVGREFPVKGCDKNAVVNRYTTTASKFNIVVLLLSINSPLYPLL